MGGTRTHVLLLGTPQKNLIKHYAKASSLYAVSGAFRRSFQILRTESPLSSLNKAGNHSYYTRRNKKELLSIPYSRTVTEPKSVENRLRQAYNWLKDRDLIPKEIRRLSNSQISLQLKKISELYVIGSNVSISIFDTLS